MEHQGALARILLAVSLALMPRGESGTLAAQARGAAQADRPCAVARPKTGQLPRVVVTHRSLDRAATCSIRLLRGDQLWVEIADANELIYEYKLVDVEIPASAPPQAFVAFLSATTATGQQTSKQQVLLGLQAERAEPSGRRQPPPASPADPFPADSGMRVQRHAFLARRLVLAALDVRRWLAGSDTIGPDSASVARIRDGMKGVMDAARAEVPFAESTGVQLDDLWRWTTALRDSIRGVRPPVSSAELAQVERYHDALSRLYPDAANLARQLLDLRLGKRFLVSNDRSGTFLLRLSVKPRLGTDYQTVRRTTSAEVGLNILRITPAAPWFKASAGLSWTPRDGRSVYSERLNDDTTFFETRPRDGLTPIPSSFFGLEFPLSLGGRDLVLGLGAGAGLRIGAGDVQLTDALDYSLFLTIGYEWFRLHVGWVWSAEVDETTLPLSRNSDRVPFTTDNRRLSDFAMARQRYWFIGVARTL